LAGHATIKAFLILWIIHVPKSIVPESVAIATQLTVPSSAQRLRAGSLRTILLIARMRHVSLPHLESLRRCQTILRSLIDALACYGATLLVHHLACSHHDGEVLATLVIHAVAHRLSRHIAHSLPVNDIALQATHRVKVALQSLVLVLVQSLRVAQMPSMDNLLVIAGSSSTR
jgi:hypothetical protein